MHDKAMTKRRPDLHIQKMKIEEESAKQQLFCGVCFLLQSNTGAKHRVLV
jgi:hypothetical protein